MDNEILEKRVKDLEEENAKLRKIIIDLNNKLSSAYSRINRAYHDSYDDVTPEREDR